MASPRNVAIAKLLSANAQWATAVETAEPGFFAQSAKGQKPHTLWIGCADSRVPESVITGSRPGEIFVQRNIANQFHPNDGNALSVLRYSVNVLGVQHVIVVGHSECGGAAACLSAAKSDSTDGAIATIPSLPADTDLNVWLAPLTKLVRSLQLTGTPREEALSAVVEANVKMQVENLCNTDVIMDAWTIGTPVGQEVWVHGFVYDLASGRLRDLSISRGPANSSTI